MNAVPRQWRVAGSYFEACDFALSWRVVDGQADELDLDDVDEQASTAQREALTGIFLGRAGGTALENFGRLIGEVYAVRAAWIALEHARGREEIVVERHVVVRGTAPDGAVSCGIPGHDHPGQELTADLLQVDDGALRWHVTGRCAFATDFDYRSAA